MPITGVAALVVPGAESLTLEHAYKAMEWLGETQLAVKEVKLASRRSILWDYR
jgi:hypothetical protein